ncbi:hypothetical protein [Sphingomonas immobilis]|uniref:Uncharacterized protein n=1 Tax=Sphingomonas immobilis TaxID=3063997 RepID=A0ABT9A1M5_9SPHN|nr:hypothetical protein [Sphingomonas sp. CA1-15]MDO7843731.1 hypothetical protein [Sphingomonas sp. CA1-15]
MRTYNVVISDTAGTSMNVRLRLPFVSTFASSATSTWHGDGGKIMYAHGSCDTTKEDGWKPTTVRLAVNHLSGLQLHGFFDSIGLHNASGSGYLYSQWAGGTMLPGELSWADAD